MIEKWLTILFRWFSGVILCFFCFIPATIFVKVLETHMIGARNIDIQAVLVLLGSGAMTYFFGLLAYRAFTGRGRKQDGGLMPSWAMKGFIHLFGVFAVIIVIFGFLEEDWRPILGGVAYLIVAYSALSMHSNNQSNRDRDA